jgi:hypothetical protein
LLSSRNIADERIADAVGHLALEIMGSSTQRLGGDQQAA